MISIEVEIPRFVSIKHLPSLLAIEREKNKFPDEEKWIFGLSHRYDVEIKGYHLEVDRRYINEAQEIILSK